MNTYEAKKARAREKAASWQHEGADAVLSYADMAEAAAYFERLGRRYGLLTEFRENGIC